MPAGPNGHYTNDHRAEPPKLILIFRGWVWTPIIRKITDRGQLRCLCRVQSHIQTKQRKPPPHLLSLLLLSELSRFTSEEQSEECAFSGEAVFSRLGRGKSTKKSIRTRSFFENEENPLSLQPINLKLSPQ